MLEGRKWYGVAGALRQSLDVLRAVAPLGLPESYMTLLAFSDGGEGPLPINPFTVCLDPADTVAEGVRNNNHGPAEFDEFLIFGGNGGGEYLAFDMRSGLPWPIVMIDMVAGRGSAQIIAPDFDTFVGLIGVEEPTG